jgi:hypothetical protein
VVEVVRPKGSRVGLALLTRRYPGHRVARCSQNTPALERTAAVVFVGIDQLADLARGVWLQQLPVLTRDRNLVSGRRLDPLVRQCARMGECSGTYLGGPERSFYALRLRGRLEGGQSHQE